MTALAVLISERGLTVTHHGHHMHRDHGENCCELWVCFPCSHPHECSVCFKFYTLDNQVNISYLGFEVCSFMTKEGKDSDLLYRVIENPDISPLA